jgi:dihydrofolate reductase
MLHNIKLIVCCDSNYGIGYENTLPWNVPKDMKLFRKKTIGNKNNCVIMGKNTYESIPKKYFPFSSRYNCILSSSLTEVHFPNTCICQNKDELFQFIENSKFEEYWIIGGNMIYDLLLQSNKVDEIHMSMLDTSYTCDTWFPSEHLDSFTEIESVSFLHFTSKVFKKNQKMDCP